jgi:hypothetical protein
MEFKVKDIHSEKDVNKDLYLRLTIKVSRSFSSGLWSDKYILLTREYFNEGFYDEKEDNFCFYSSKLDNTTDNGVWYSIDVYTDKISFLTKKLNKAYISTKEKELISLFYKEKIKDEKRIRKEVAQVEKIYKEKLREIENVIKRIK